MTPNPRLSGPARRPWLAAELGALVVLGLAWALWPSDDGAPGRALWRAGDSLGPIEPMAHVPLETPLALELALDRPMHVYVASWDVVRGTIAMFPSATLRAARTANPLPAGTHRLPGELDRVALSWHAGDGVGATTFVVLVSERPIQGLDAALASCRQMGNAAFPTRRVCGVYAPAAGMDATPPRHTPAHAALVAARDLQDPLHDGPFRPLPGFDGVFAKVLRVTTEPAGPTNDLDALREQARTQLDAVQGALGAPAEAPPPAPAGR